MIKAIIPECYVDTCLIEVLLGVEKLREGVNHGKGNSTVANKMKEKFADSFSLGIIDSDNNRKPITYLNEFKVINDKIKATSILLRHHNPDTHHYFIQICPESEHWICRVSEDLKLSLLNDYDLPERPKELMTISKRINIRNDERFLRLFKDIKTKALEIQYEPVIKLLNWLIELKDNTYTADRNKLEA